MKSLIDVDIKVLPSQVDDTDLHHKIVRSKVKANASRIKSIVLDRRSIDARGRKPLYFLRYKVYLDNPPVKQEPYLPLTPIDKSKKCLVIGAGPAGYFAALRLIELGICPIVLDRGKDVRRRRRDLKAIQQDGIINPHSNYCFGEGGAGTYSDGKLYTRSHKRGSISKILKVLVEHGANPDIMIDTHPHIGSNKLPAIVSAIRTTIENSGGEVHFDSFVTDLIINNQAIEGVVLQNGLELKGDAVILATGHSARDIYHLLDNKNITVEAKPFALGVRIEHSQSFIDKVQYNQGERDDNLPAASYSVACQIDDLGVFSFCMCPGGLIVPAATAPGEIVVNGMSLSRRDSPFANSGFVTAVELPELQAHGYTGKFAALNFQKEVEQNIFNAGDGSQKAPSQRVMDFVDQKSSDVLNPTSYIPGLISSPLHKILPSFIAKRLREGLIDINRRMPGYLTNDANIVATESRTSAPVRIPRNPSTLMHDDVKGLFPCGEGAGYAGGILSAAMDGDKVALSVKKFFDSFSI